MSNHGNQITLGILGLAGLALAVVMWAPDHLSVLELLDIVAR